VTVTFPAQPAARYDESGRAVTFPALVDGKPVTCLVTEECLIARAGSRFPCTAKEALRGYEEYREEIRALAEAVIRRSGANEAGVVCVNSATVT
jgi:hypothetical protein